MYSLSKQLITEKDIRRKVDLLENLVNYSHLTAKELAERIHTTQRTVFSVIKELRLELPKGWKLESDGNNGFSLSSENYATTNELWEHFMRNSINIQIVKELLSAKKLATQSYIFWHRISFDTMKRHITKLNKELRDFHLKISVSTTNVQWIGEEASIRLFYHRLLLPFTHKNFFFDKYPIHEMNYTSFLRQLGQTRLKFNTEEIFGICWFFINTIRIKNGCLIEEMNVKRDNILFQLYKKELKNLYALEGIQLNPTELFFAFFAFMESWNYNALPTDELNKILTTNYPTLFSSCEAFINRLIDKLALPALQHSSLLDNLVLFSLKYYESRQLSDNFLMKYQEANSFVQQRFPVLYQLIFDEVVRYERVYLPLSSYVINTITLLVQEASFCVHPQQITTFFLFQGEPAWKNFLFRELQALTGERICLKSIHSKDLDKSQLATSDLIISNYPLDDSFDQKILYISSIPTQNELKELRELIQPFYL